MNLAKKQLIQHLIDYKIDLERPDLESMISDQLISPYTLVLPASFKAKAQKFIQTAHAFSHSKSYQIQRHADYQLHGLPAASNFGLMMSYDFHLDEALTPRLIEVNTNASFLALGYFLTKAQGRIAGIDFQLEDLKNCILNELKLSGKEDLSQVRIAIVDDKPQFQKLVAEFHLYKKIFEEFGFAAEIVDTSMLESGKFDFIYNRDTDFYFADPRTEKLRELYASGSVIVSPHPYEYFLSADKENLIQWGLPEIQQAFSEERRQLPPSAAPIDLIDMDFFNRVLLKTEKLTPANAEDVWARRKNLFIKPQASYGSKSSFKGASISRKVFEETLGTPMIAQEVCPAPQLSSPENEMFKYDLRAYAYGPQFQFAVARLYQGQLTNARTPNGGFACIAFDEKATEPELIY